MPDWTSGPGRAGPGRFPPGEIAEVKALACELPATSGRPLSRWSAAELAREAIERGIVCSVSGTTVWRWLAEDAIRPWAWRSWVFPRDPDFRSKAVRVLDLYERRWQGKRLRPDEYVISADEKTQLQALLRRYPLLAPGPGRPGRYEHEYQRNGTLAYLAAIDVHDPKRGLFGRLEPRVGNDPFDRLLDQIMTSEPYASARTVFVVVDNGTTTEANPRSTASRRHGRPSGSYTCPHTPPGSTRSRSTSRSSNEKHSPPATSQTPTSSPNASSASRPNTRNTPDRSTGPSPATTSTGSSTASTNTADSPPQPERTSVTEY